MNAYCERHSVDFNSIAFLFDCHRLQGEQTPDEVTSQPSPCTSLTITADPERETPCSLQLEMEEGDEIDVMLHRTGGAMD